MFPVRFMSDEEGVSRAVARILQPYRVCSVSGLLRTCSPDVQN